MFKIAKYKIINSVYYVSCKKAPFPFNIILLIFKKTMCSANSTVSMINPFTKNIYTIIDNNSIVEDNKPHISLSLYLHEFIHLCQVKRDGIFKYLCKYMWYNIRYGYRNNLYEVEAREVSELVFNGYTLQYNRNYEIMCMSNNEIYIINDLSTTNNTFLFIYINI